MSAPTGEWIVHADQTIDAIILANEGPNGLTVALPAGLTQVTPAGRYFLVRCGAQSESERAANWQIYARRPLFAADVKRLDDAGTAWTLLPRDHAGDPGVAWLQTREVGERVNLIGPLGQGFVLPGQAANVLLLTDGARLPLFQTLVDGVLDRGGRLAVLATGDAQLEAARRRLPLAVELRSARHEAELLAELADTLAWADLLCVASPTLQPELLAQSIRTARFRLEEGFAQILVDADLVCGVGACLACVVPTAGGGLTRACVHGPVIDLVKLARQ